MIREEAEGFEKGVQNLRCDILGRFCLGAVIGKERLKTLFWKKREKNVFWREMCHIA
jgi:hypothetical protein